MRTSGGLLNKPIKDEIKKTTIITSLIILLLTISSTVSAQQQEKEYTYQVRIVNSKGKPQPDIYAYYETNGQEKRYFKSDDKGLMSITKEQGLSLGNPIQPSLE